MPWDSESKGYYRNKRFSGKLQQSLYFIDYSQNEILSSGKVVSSTGSFICAISIGTLIMELQALRQCVEGIITKIKVFWELQQSIYFIYATLCVESTQKVWVKSKKKIICICYVYNKYCTWYFKNLFLLCLGFPPGSKLFKEDDWRCYEMQTGNKSWQVSAYTQHIGLSLFHVIFWVYYLSTSTNLHCTKINKNVGRI